MSRIPRRDETAPTNFEQAVKPTASFQSPAPEAKQESDGSFTSHQEQAAPAFSNKAPVFNSGGSISHSPSLVSRLSLKPTHLVVIVASIVAISSAGYVGYQQAEDRKELQRQEEIRVRAEEYQRQEAKLKAEADARLAEEKAKAEEIARLEAEKKAAEEKEAAQKLAAERSSARAAIAQKKTTEKTEVAGTGRKTQPQVTGKSGDEKVTSYGMGFTPPPANTKAQQKPSEDAKSEVAKQDPAAEKSSESSGIDMKKAIPAAAAILGGGALLYKFLKKD